MKEGIRGTDNFLFEVMEKKIRRVMIEFFSINFLIKTVTEWIEYTDYRKENIDIINWEILFLLKSKNTFCEQVIDLFIEQIKKDKLFFEKTKDKINCFIDEIEKIKKGEQLSKFDDVINTTTLMQKTLGKKHNSERITFALVKEFRIIFIVGALKKRAILIEQEAHKIWVTKYGGK